MRKQSFCARVVCTPAVLTPLRVLYYLFIAKEEREEGGVAAHVVELDTHSKGELKIQKPQSRHDPRRVGPNVVAESNKCI